MTAENTSAAATPDTIVLVHGFCMTPGVTPSTGEILPLKEGRVRGKTNI